MRNVNTKVDRLVPVDRFGGDVSKIVGQFAINQLDDEIPSDSLHVMLLSLYDWVGVGLAGTEEPVSNIVRNMVIDEGGRTESSVFGTDLLLPARSAALSNGTTSHSLDYDDTHFAHVGHPSVVVISATLALAEKFGVSSRKFLTASLIGAEIACRIGTWLGRQHYQAGFHQTATSGCFGATVAGCRILGLSVNETRNALGIASTRASGLKSQFGTMGKPYNAGIAASNAVEAALLAATGFESRVDSLECSQGFAETHAGEFKELDFIFEGLGKSFCFENVLHKFHACCHGLHAAIEAIAKIQLNYGIAPDDVRTVTIVVNPRWLKVCNIEHPNSGLEAKFSFKHVAALTLMGKNTARLDTFSQELCQNPDLTALRVKTIVETDEQLGDTEAVVCIVSHSGDNFEVHQDLSIKMVIEEREQKLKSKITALLGESGAEKLWLKLKNLSESSVSIQDFNLTVG